MGQYFYLPWPNKVICIHRNTDLSMGIKLQRQKKRNLLLSCIYRIHKILPISSKRKLKLYLDLEWIFDRLSHETSFQYYDEDQHPIRVHSKQFILNRIQEDHIVLDLGCKYGNMSHYISQKAKKVTGIDFDQKAIQIAKETYQQSNLNFEVEEALSYIERQDFKFDVLILSHILEHLNDPTEFLASFAQHFKLIYIELPDFNKTYLNLYRQKTGNNLIYTDTDHISEFDRFELSKLILDCGLKIIEEEYIFGIQKIWCTLK